MPTITDNATRQAYKFKGKTVNVPVHFAVGHTMTEDDARFANRQLASVTGNVLASALNRLANELASKDKPEGYKPTDAERDAALKSITDTQAQEMFDKIYGNYKIGQVVSRDGSSLHDPVTAIARNIAWERVKGLLRTRKIKVSSVKADKKTELVDDMLKRDPSIMETAKAQVGATVPTDGLDDLFAGLEADTSTDSTTEANAGASAAAPNAASTNETNGDTGEGAANPGLAQPANPDVQNSQAPADNGDASGPDGGSPEGGDTASAG